MMRNLLRPFLLDLGEMEGDYRVAQLRDDIRQSMIYIVITIASVLSMLRLDASLFWQRGDVFPWLIAYRGGYILISILALVALSRTTRVRMYDRIMFGWMAVTVFFLLSFDLTRPPNFAISIFDIIIPFVIYIFSPLKMAYNVILAVMFSAGSIYIDHVYKIGIDPITLNAVTAAQLLAQVVGLVSGLQIQSYRRKSFRAYIQERDAREMVAYLANIDTLTKSLTRHHFFNIAESEFLRFRRYHRNLSLLVLDADHFKSINDNFGHYAGDLVLRSLSLVVLEQKRAQDTFGRLGGEEFALLLPETSLEQAKVVAQRIQSAWSQTPSIVDGHAIYCTVSIGVAQAQAEDASFETILRRADRMMYKAKEAGRNTVAAE